MVQEMVVGGTSWGARDGGSGSSFPNQSNKCAPKGPFCLNCHNCKSSTGACCLHKDTTCNMMLMRRAMIKLFMVADRSCRMELEHNWFTCRNGHTTMLKLEGVPSYNLASASWSSDCMRALIERFASPRSKITLSLCANKPSSCLETSYTCETKGTACMARHPTRSARCNGSHMQHSGMKLRAPLGYATTRSVCIRLHNLPTTSDERWLPADVATMTPRWPS